MSPSPAATGSSLSAARRSRELAELHEFEQFADLALEFGDSPEWQVEVRRAAQGPEWLFLLTHRAVIDLAVIQGIRKSLTEMASRTGGEYDGWEAGVPS